VKLREDKMDKKAKIKIPKRLKETIMKRFDPKNAIVCETWGVYAIEIPCIMCDTYDCSGCPAQGCIRWMKDRVNVRFKTSYSRVEWNMGDDEHVRENLQELLQHFESDIDWV
jgi:hypothetical protein